MQKGNIKEEGEDNLGVNWKGKEVERGVTGVK